MFWRMEEWHWEAYYSVLATKFSISEHMWEVTTKNQLSTLSLSSCFTYTATLWMTFLEKFNKLDLRSRKTLKNSKPEYDTSKFCTEIDILYTKVLFHIDSALHDSFLPSNDISSLTSCSNFDTFLKINSFY